MKQHVTPWHLNTYTPIRDGFVDLLPGGLVLPLQLVLQLFHLLHVLPGGTGEERVRTETARRDTNIQKRHTEICNINIQSAACSTAHRVPSVRNTHKPQQRRNATA